MTARKTLLVAFVLAFAVDAVAQTVNVDVNGAASGDVTYAGADGILSGAGTQWNGSTPGTDIADLADESGVSTGFGLEWSGSSGGTNSQSTNTLQDSGTFASFDVVGLDPAATYDVALYGEGLLDFGDAASPFNACNNFGSTFVLPGVENADYCLFTDRTPREISTGVFGFSFAGSDGALAGIQIRGAAAIPLPLWAVILLAGGFGAVVWRRLNA
ncbi:MAG: hypothetical protein AAFX44_08945 [Pseudomonadota bacterium]